MFTNDESPAHVVATPAAQAHLAGLAAAGGDVTIMLTDHGAEVLPAGGLPPHGSVHLGHLDDACTITALAYDQLGTSWWSSRAQLDLDPDSRMTYGLAPLSEAELFAALAAGPLPHY